MKKVYITSIQGQNLIMVNGEREPHGQYENVSYIKVLDLVNGEKLDWKLGAFTQSQESNIHTEEEIKNLEALGLQVFYIHPWNIEKNNKDIMKYLKKMGYFNLEEDEDIYGNEIGSVFDGYVFIGEVDLDKVN